MTSTQLRSVLVTGCSSGIGRFTADHLRSRGWQVIATVRKHEDVVRLKDDGFQALQLDLDSTTSIQDASRDALQLTSGALYGVVHNAGIEVLGAVEDLGRSDLRACFETNVFGPMELTARLLPALREQNRGRLIFVSSSNSNGFGYPFMGPGNASKCALECLATSLKRELSSTKITVSTVCPGEVSTNILSSMIRRSRNIMDSPVSRHAQTYAAFERRLTASGGPSDETVAVVARAIATLLESDAPARRTVVPASATLHYLSHVVLPEWLQDKLLYHRMRKVFGIHV